jgi:basic membrane lipoprotein Med (substrate-binding protein (PBP1-ABC) superfamily)
MIDTIQKGVTGGKAYNLTLQNNGLVIKYNSGYSVPADAKAAADKATQDIISGKVTVQP